MSRTPLPATIWEDVLQIHGAVKLEQPEDTKVPNPPIDVALMIVSLEYATLE